MSFTKVKLFLLEETEKQLAGLRIDDNKNIAFGVRQKLMDLSCLANEKRAKRVNLVTPTINIRDTIPVKKLVRILSQVKFFQG